MAVQPRQRDDSGKPIQLVYVRTARFVYPDFQVYCFVHHVHVYRRDKECSCSCCQRWWLSACICSGVYHYRIQHCHPIGGMDEQDQESRGTGCVRSEGYESLLSMFICTCSRVPRPRPDFRRLGWFSMSPLPRLHHYDIMTIVGT